MSGDEAFLARWSRRKREAAAQADAKTDPPPTVADTAKPVRPAASEPPPAAPLAPADAIDATSDVKAFLTADVPLEIAREALRRAWSADPAIRDFIGLSENAWDFNGPGGVPGFGPLDLEDVRQLAARVLGEPRTDAQSTAGAANADHSAIPAKPPPVAPATEPPKSIAVAQHEEDQRKACGLRPRRRHGGALPQ